MRRRRGRRGFARVSRRSFSRPPKRGFRLRVGRRM